MEDEYGYNASNQTNYMIECNMRAQNTLKCNEIIDEENWHTMKNTKIHLTRIL